MSFIKYSDTSRADLVRLYEFLNHYDQKVAKEAIDTIVSGVDYISKLDFPPSNGQLIFFKCLV
jgi:hypothetical protein